MNDRVKTYVEGVLEGYQRRRGPDPEELDLFAEAIENDDELAAMLAEDTGASVACVRRATAAAVLERQATWAGYVLSDCASATVERQEEPGPVAATLR
jgi:hypothetical protein